MDVNESGHPTAEDESRRLEIRRLFDETRRRLVETGTRNRLIHVNRQARRSNVLDFINERSDSVYSLLVSERRAMRFLATGRDKDDDSDTPSLALSDDPSFDESRYDDRLLETRLGPDALQKRLLKLARDARTAEEEQGINILYLAVGFLAWYEDKSSSVKREAPLVLIPVELVRNAKSSTYDLRARDDDIVTNLPLQERLKSDFGIKLPDIDVDEDWHPSRYFDEVAEVIAQRDRWQIDRDGMQLGFFSFAKLLMFHDLDPDNWPGGTLEAHDLARGLLYERFEPEEPLFGKEDKLDERLSPHQIYHVVDADASQAKVIEEVRSGRNLVVQGPPGTGKSQTITNIIAAATRDGKRVLFVAEKMAALSVVHKRLLDVGLADICLELHSKTANKKAVLGELARTVGAAHSIPSMPSDPELLKETRDRLNYIAAELHHPVGSSDDSAFSALAEQVRFMEEGAPPPQLEVGGLDSMCRARAVRLATILREYGDTLEAAGSLTGHPYYGTQKTDMQPTDLARLERQLVDGAGKAAALAEASEVAAEALGLESVISLAAAPILKDQLLRLTAPPSLDRSLLVLFLESSNQDRLRETLLAGAEWRQARDEANSLFVDAAWSGDPAPLRGPIAAGQSSFFARWGSAYRGASRELAGLLTGPLPKSAAERSALIDLLLMVIALRDAWRHDENWCASSLGEEWRGERSPFSTLLTGLDWARHATGPELKLDATKAVNLALDSTQLERLSKALATTIEPARSTIEAVVDALQLDIEKSFRETKVTSCGLRSVAARFTEMAQCTPRYEEWALLVRLRDAISAEGFAELLARIDNGPLTGEAAATELLFGRAEAVWKAAMAASPLLSSLRSLDRHELAAKFSKLEKERLGDVVKLIRATHLKQVPQGAAGAMGILRSEFARRRGHMPLRKLFKNAAEAIQRIKPVLLMSPISVAQFLSPGSIEFDLLVIDEASQVRPEDALGAVARARQIVVVGDQKQLPPSSFFDRLASNNSDGDDDANDGNEDSLLGGAARAAEMESILTLCEARGLSPRMLEWHYRSRDPSLIRVSNQEFYDGGLILPPSPLQDDPAYGLVFTHVAGEYDRGGKRDNRLEGAAIVRRVAEHAASSPGLSLGVVTFSSAQRNLITELLEYDRRQNPILDGFLREGGTEDVFVKNIENVQGDERDVILISVGYGPSQAGGRLTTMNFGPINNDGGERRLNVLFTRARLRCEIFASFDPGDIDLKKVSKEGPRVLKRFLEYAKTGLIDEKVPSGAGADTPFEAAVASAIRTLGYEVDHQVGSAGFLIDLGVRHPRRTGTYILAVECDGATYHSALWARERDRLRQGVLEHLGWRFHRIWSTDWFYRRVAELNRLKEALEAAVEASDKSVVIQGANDIATQRPTSEKATLTAFELPETPVRRMPPYLRSQVSVRSSLEPHAASPTLLAQLAWQIVEDEGPIHEEEVARRIAGAFGKERAGVRIVAAVQKALRAAQRSADLRKEGSFWATAAQAAKPVVRNRSAESGPVCKPACIAMSELTEAIRIAMEDNAGGSDQEIIRAAAHLFGFRRVGPDVQARLQAGLDEMQKSAEA